MKTFHFPLEGVLSYRRTQVRVEEAKLERLHHELRAIQGHEATLHQEREQARTALVTARSAMGAEFAALEHYRHAAARQFLRLEQAQADCNQRIASQMDALAQKRRDARLLEKLRERRLEEWRYSFSRETETQAEEAFLARWNATCSTGL